MSQPGTVEKALQFVSQSEQLVTKITDLAGDECNVKLIAPLLIIAVSQCSKFQINEAEMTMKQIFKCISAE